MIRSIVFLWCLFSLISINALAQKIGSPAIEISLKTPEGQVVNLSTQKGKIVLVDFWASWCGPCRKNNKLLKPLYDKYKSLGFEIFGISLDEDVAGWKRAIQADGISWLQCIDSEGAASPTAYAWRVYKIPTAYLLDGNGVIISVDPTIKELSKLLSGLL